MDCPPIGIMGIIAIIGIMPIIIGIMPAIGMAPPPAAMSSVPVMPSMFAIPSAAG